MRPGTCWIYKRATLHLPDHPPQIIDYSDGTQSQQCTNIDHNGQHPVYVWTLPNKVLHIPLNIKRYNTDSIIRQGHYRYKNGYIAWEYIFGKYSPTRDFYLMELRKYIPFVLIIVFLLFIVRGQK